MPRLKWSRPAMLDLDRLRKFLASKNPDAARRAIQTIRQGVKIVCRHPEIGRPLPDLNALLRELVIPFGESAYVVRYLYDGQNSVAIISVRHGREAGD